jgi:hypothetical protein
MMGFGRVPFIWRTFAVSGFLCLALFGFSAPSARAIDEIDLGDLQDQGWDCDINVSEVGSCTDPATGRVASCSQVPVMDVGIQTICDLRDRDGRLLQDFSDTPGVFTTSGRLNEQTGQYETDSESGVEQLINAAGDAIANTFLMVVLSPVAIVSFLILALASFLLGIAGLIFNWAVAFLVFNFGTFFGNSEGLLLAWGILRDFGNMILLFGFVYMGIMTILQIGHFNVGKTLSRLVIFAVLLNFSLFITEAIIDTTNVLASALYSQASPCDVSDGNCLVNQGIASEILNMAGIGAALGFGDSQAAALQVSEDTHGGQNYINNPVGTTLKFLGLALIVTTAAVVLFAGAFFLISRAIHLVWLMVVSPIGFAGMAVPWLEKMAKDWWHTLLNQALFAPVFLLLIFVALKLLEGLQGLSNGGDIASALSTPNALNTGPLLFFALVIAFLIGALMLAKNFGIYGADMVVKNAQGLIGRAAGAATFGAYGWAGRRTLGAASNAAGRAIRRSNLVTTNPQLARYLAGVADKGAKSSFDARSTGITPSQLGKVGKTAKGGIAGIMHAEEEKHVKWDESYKKDRKLQFEELEQQAGVLNRKANKLEEDGRFTKAAEMREKAEKMEERAENTIYAREKEAKKEVSAERTAATAEMKASQATESTHREQFANIEAKIDEMRAKGTPIDDKDFQKLLADRDAVNAKLLDAQENTKVLAERVKTLAEQEKNFGDEYARSLEQAAERFKYIPLSMAKRPWRAAAREIIEEIHKSPEEKEKDKIMKFIKKAAEGGGGGGHDDHGGGHGGGGGGAPKPKPAHAATHDAGHAH